MKNKMLAILLISSFMSVTVTAAETSVDAIDAETRIVTLNADTLDIIDTTSDEAASENTLTEENTIELMETKYSDESGFSLWYNAESLKSSEYGGQFCFIPSEEEDSLKSPAILIIVPNEAGEMPSPLGEVTAMYPPENVSEIKETTSEEGITIQSVKATDAGQHFVFYIVSYEDVSLNITSMSSDEEHVSYIKEFDRIVETLSFEEITAEETVEEKAVA